MHSHQMSARGNPLENLIGDMMQITLVMAWHSTVIALHRLCFERDKARNMLVSGMDPRHYSSMSQIVICCCSHMMLSHDRHNPRDVIRSNDANG